MNEYKIWDNYFELENQLQKVMEDLYTYKTALEEIAELGKNSNLGHIAKEALTCDEDVKFLVEDCD